MKKSIKLTVGNHASHQTLGLVEIMEISIKFQIVKIKQLAISQFTDNCSLTHLVPLETLSPSL